MLKSIPKHTICQSVERGFELSSILEFNSSWNQSNDQSHIMSTSTANAPINHISPSLSPSMTASNAQMSSSEIVQPIDSSSIDSTDTVAATTTMRATVHIANNANASPALSQSIDYREEFPTFQEIYHRTNNSTRITFGERVRRVISLLACVSPLARTRRSNRNRWQRTVKVKRKRSIQKHLIIKVRVGAISSLCYIFSYFSSEAVLVRYTILRRCPGRESLFFLHGFCIRLLFLLTQLVVLFRHVSKIYTLLGGEKEWCIG